MVKNLTYSRRREKIAGYAKALGHPVRIFILDFLAENSGKSCYSGDMAGKLPIARSTLSQHLKELKESGLIEGKSNPPYIKYSIDSKNWAEAKRVFKAFFKR